MPIILVSWAEFMHFHATILPLSFQCIYTIVNAYSAQLLMLLVPTLLGAITVPV